MSVSNGKEAEEPFSQLSTEEGEVKPSAAPSNEATEASALPPDTKGNNTHVLERKYERNNTSRLYDNVLNKLWY